MRLGRFLLVVGCAASLNRDGSAEKNDDQIEEKRKAAIKKELEDIEMPNVYSKKDILYTFSTAFNLLFSD
jgi:hypothetical protein